MQLSRVTTAAARQEQGDAAPAPKEGVSAEGAPSQTGRDARALSQPLPRVGDIPSRSALGCARLPISGALRAAPSLSGSGAFPTPHLGGVIKHGAYFHLQGLHCCEQVFKSVPHFWSKGTMAILSYFCKALGAYKQCASPKCCYLPQCCRPRLRQSKKSQLFWAVPYTIYFCQPQAHDAAWEIGTGDKAGKIQDPAEGTKKFSCCGCASPLVKESRSCDWQAAKYIFNDDIITNNDLQLQK